MTEVDALLRARGLLEEPAAPRAPGAGLLSLSVLMAVLAIAAAGAVILSPPTWQQASR